MMCLYSVLAKTGIIYFTELKKRLFVCLLSFFLMIDFAIAEADIAIIWLFHTRYSKWK